MVHLHGQTADKEGAMDNRDEIAGLFYIDDHALLFGMLAKAADQLFGSRGDEAGIYALRLYAAERGERMARRAREDHMPLTLETYRIYTEWEDVKKLMRIETIGLSPNYRMNGVYCVWDQTWKKFHLEKYGRMYCSNVDQAMVRSFNPENELIIHSTLSHNGSGCDFEWVGLDYSAPDALQMAAKQKQSLRTRAVKDFLYHCGHMLSAMRRGYLDQLGAEASDKITRQAMAEYKNYFGDKKGEAVIEESMLDFQVV